ncbi:MAG: siroheme synthase CysG [Methyloligellaceae bacterium]
MRYFPVYMDMQEARVLIVGGGEQAAQKLRLLLKTDVSIDLIAHEIVPEIEALKQSGRIQVHNKDFSEQDLSGYRMVYAAIEEDDLAERVSHAAQARNIPVNVVDRPDLCTFITPAIVDRDPVTVAIGTEGTAPVLAREIKSKLEAWLPANYGTLAAYANSFRNFIAEKVEDGRQRRIVWQNLLGGEFRRLVLAGKQDEAKAVLEEEVAASVEPDQKIGTVALIGCGPGDPGLLTLKAQQHMQTADVLVIDRLVNPEILEYARRDAERIFVGKKPGAHTTPQKEINRILLREALAGKTVARLKGGDPFVFGRASEELLALQPHGVEVEIVPGITAAHACAASVELPLTMREHHRVFSILTGATVDGVPEHDWRMLAAEGQAFAVYMGVRNSGEIKLQLLNAGIDPATPVVIVENGTLKNEKSVSTNIDELDICVEQAGIKGPAIIFIGNDWSHAGLSRPRKVVKFKQENVVPLSLPKESVPQRA